MRKSNHYAVHLELVQHDMSIIRVKLKEKITPTWNFKMPVCTGSAQQPEDLVTPCSASLSGGAGNIASEMDKKHHQSRYGLFWLCPQLTKAPRAGIKPRKSSDLSHNSDNDGSFNPRPPGSSLASSPPLFFGLLRAPPTAYGGSQDRDQIVAAAAATGTQDLSCIHNLHCSLWQHQILNPRSEASDQTHILMDMARFCSWRATMGTPLASFFAGLFPGA